MTSVWENLTKVNVNEHVRKKGNFSYLSWPWAWAHIKEKYPHATYEKHWHLQPDGHSKLPYAVDASGFAYVQVTVTIEGLAKTETYPVTNHSNQSIKNPDSFAVNTALQRCMVKAIGLHGLGHYIYAGEDLPADTVETSPAPAPQNPKANGHAIETPKRTLSSNEWSHYVSVQTRAIDQAQTLAALELWTSTQGNKLQNLLEADKALFDEVNLYYTEKERELKNGWET